MLNLLLMLLAAGLVIYLIGYLFFRSLIWVIEPIIEHLRRKKRWMKKRKICRFLYRRFQVRESSKMFLPYTPK
jgi:hypothetical protein